MCIERRGRERDRKRKREVTAWGVEVSEKNKLGTKTHHILIFFSLRASEGVSVFGALVLSWNALVLGSLGHGSARKKKVVGSPIRMEFNRDFVQEAKQKKRKRYVSSSASDFQNGLFVVVGCLLHG